MPSKRTLLLLFSVLLTAAGVAFVVDRNKRLTIWLARRCVSNTCYVHLLLDCYKAGSPLTKHRVVKSFGQMGDRAVVELVDALKAGDCGRCGVAGNVVAQSDEAALQKLLEIFRTGEPASRAVAGAVLADVGEPATQALIGILKEDDSALSERAAGVLVQAGAKAVPSLQNALGNPDRQVRWWVATTLGRIGPADPRGIEALNMMMNNDTDISVRAAAVAGLGEMGPAAVPLLPDLLKALDHDDPGVRAAAARSLGRVGSEDWETLAHLTAALTDEDEVVRENAWAALTKSQTGSR